MNHVTILYQGGSGGFALYYYLLLTGNFQYDVPTVHDMIRQQFSTKLINHPAHWKNVEFWPDNQTIKSQPGRKLLLICNPLFNPDVFDQNIAVATDTYKILLYTDLRLQLRMAYEKNAYWFTDVSKQKFNAPLRKTTYIRQIISTQLDGLDPEISNIKKIFKPDQLVRLEDLLQQQHIPNFLTPNSDQISFLKYWRSMQPAKSIKLLGT